MTTSLLLSSRVPTPEVNAHAAFSAPALRCVSTVCAVAGWPDATAHARRGAAPAAATGSAGTPAARARVLRATSAGTAARSPAPVCVLPASFAPSVAGGRALAAGVPATTRPSAAHCWQVAVDASAATGSIDRALALVAPAAAATNGSIRSERHRVVPLARAPTAANPATRPQPPIRACAASPSLPVSTRLILCLWLLRQPLIEIQILIEVDLLRIRI